MVSSSYILTVYATLVRTGKQIFPQTGWGSHRSDCTKRKRKIDLCLGMYCVVHDIDMN